MRFLFLGDVHGDILHWRKIFETAKVEDVTYIIQLGDMGFWEHAPKGRGYFDILAKETPCHIYWVDGNHDNMPLLWDSYGRDGIVPMRWGSHSGVTRKMRPKVSYVSRGAVFSLGGVSFQGMGGAYSIDARWRQEQHARGSEEMWWPEEEIRDSDIDNGIDAAQWFDEIDVLLCHDAPSGAPLKQLISMRLDPHREGIAQQNRQRLRRLVDRTNPKWIIHGHYHKRLRYRLESHLGRAQVEALGCNPAALEHVRPTTYEESYVILDTEQLKERIP